MSKTKKEVAKESFSLEHARNESNILFDEGKDKEVTSTLLLIRTDSQTGVCAQGDLGDILKSILEFAKEERITDELAYLLLSC